MCNLLFVHENLHKTKGDTSGLGSILCDLFEETIALILYIVLLADNNHNMHFWIFGLIKAGY